MIIGGVIVAFTLIALCGCSAGVLAIRQGAISPPQFVIDLGAVHVVGRLSSIPVCSYATSCLLEPPARDMTIYTIWVIRRSDRSDVPTSAIRLMSFVIDGKERNFFLTM